MREGLLAAHCDMVLGSQVGPFIDQAAHLVVFGLDLVDETDRLVVMADQLLKSRCRLKGFTRVVVHLGKLRFRRLQNRADLF